MKYNHFEDQNQTSDKVQVGDSTTGTSTSTTYKSSPPTEYGWVCPRCSRVNAPWKSQCDCNGYGWQPTWEWWKTPCDEWWKHVYCDSDTFRVHPETTTWKAPSSICQSDSSTTKSNPNEKIEVWANSTTQWGGSDYWDEEKKCYTNGSCGSNCVTADNNPWKQFNTLTAELNKLKYEIEEIKETK